ncbi:NAD(P)H-dependent oxidoreductase subunit E [Peptostreptococcaceae bacterium AGR-M142]
MSSAKLERDKKLKKLRMILKENRNKEGILLEVLTKAKDIFEVLDEEIQMEISKGLNIPLAEINGVLTYYTTLNEEAMGEYNIGICLGTACYVKGSQDIIDKIENTLNIKVGETTKDNKFSLNATRCVGACGLAPVMTINDEVYGKVDLEDVNQILEKYM